jgi:hypothetical protein
MPATLPVLFAALFVGTQSFVGIRAGSVEPPFAIIDRPGGVEIRQYGPRMALEVQAAGTADAARAIALERLGDFAAGANMRAAEVALSLPVAQLPKRDENGPARDNAWLWTVRVHLPLRIRAADVPAPFDSTLRVRKLPPDTFAVLRFNGVARPASTARRRAELAAVLAQSDWEPAGPAEVWFYDPSWTVPALRRNEIAVPVTPRAPG